MAKKRKVSARGGQEEAPPVLDPRDARKAINTFEDVADSDDEFHLNQDEVRLGEEPEAKRRRKWAEQEEFLDPSDEEVLGYSDSEDGLEDDAKATSLVRAPAVDDASEDDERADHPDEDEEYGWGTSNADLYGADAIETEEQALEEEKEALRLQRKQLESMDAADYGFDEEDWSRDAAGKTRKERKESRSVVTETITQLPLPTDLGPAEGLKVLKARYPEFEPLSRDLRQLRAIQGQLKADAHTSAVAVAKFRAASAYLAALIMYFSLLTSTASRENQTSTAMPARQLREHPIMTSIVTCRELWLSVSHLQEQEVASQAAPGVSLSTGDLEHEVPESARGVGKAVLAPGGANKSRAERYAEATQHSVNQRKADRVKKTEADLAGLDGLLASSRLRVQAVSSQKIDGEGSDLGEEAPLTAREAEDKATRKKSLRFYTSQIAQKANKRGAAGRNAGGDDDIPHRERLRDRQARLNAEAEKRGKRNDHDGADLGGDSDDEDRQQARRIREEAGGDEDYYDLIAARTAQKKSDKATLAEAQRQAALQGGRVVVEEQETTGADGKRKITYAIEKNKGLTPHRKKDVRNPRVKKRKKFDEKKKKLASMKPVYKGGEGRGGYGGELTGIKKGLVKSTKL